jgi:hypothetical protein
MCCFFTALLVFGPRLAILVWWIYSPVYITNLFQSWIGFDWILLGLGVFADMATYFGGYYERERVPYGDQIP